MSKEDYKDLRLVKIFTQFNRPSTWQYQFFKGEHKLSLNLDAWMNQCGLVSYNMPYQNECGYTLSLNGFDCLRFLVENNIHYQSISFIEDLYTLVSRQSTSVYSSWEGELSLRIKSNGPNTNAGKDDYTSDRIPIGTVVKERVVEILSVTKDVEAMLFFELYPYGRENMRSSGHNFLTEIKRRLFHKDQRFRKNAEWMFNLSEKRRMQFQASHVLHKGLSKSNPTKRELLARSQYKDKNLS